ncbi:efflux RND transporter permease subunit [Bacilliculturomica massiliensis]|uniref:efflux RND transporter permease subunit n=1 Tax=Bacilliculturomica massiliensis TaxID=1917867 RepID=UPI00102FD2A4|nr:efflux RND transporter permease subunit [Bacilliculturomica massiliensis]
MDFTRTILKRPVTIAMAVLCLLYFGISSVMSMKQELTPEMEMPMLIVATVYAGAGPEDVTELVTKPIEDSAGTLTGVKSVTSTSSDGSSVVLLQYEYGTDTDKAYDDLKKKIDTLSAAELPDDAGDPMIIEMNMNDTAVLQLVADNKAVSNLYNYVDENVTSELEKLSSVAEVNVTGGQKEYISISLQREKLEQYGLDMSAVANAVAAADLSYPAGTVRVGDQDLSVTTSSEYGTVESLKRIPISAGGGNVIYLKDVASIQTARKDADSIARYNGEDTISISVKKQQESTAQDCSADVRKAIGNLMKADPDLNITVVSDTSQDISDSLKSVAETMVLAVIISMVVIFLFFGDWKASLIVGTSIPISILTALILLNFMGFSLNIITMAAIVMGVGMMVDNSIVVLESCFRVTDLGERDSIDYEKGALDGTGAVRSSILGSTLTTCVVFLPLAFIAGMSGQMFKPLGYTIVFCMAASLISAVTIVPLCYKLYRPLVNLNAPMYRPVERLQEGYRRLMRVLLPKKKTVIGASVALLICALALATQLGFELIPSDDTGTVNVTVDLKPGLSVEKADQVLEQVEKIIAGDPDLEDYLVSYGGSGLSLGSGNSASVTAYLKDDRKRDTEDVADEWERELSGLSNCTVTAESGSSMSMMSGGNDYELILRGTQYDDLKECSDQIVEELYQRSELSNVHSSLENAASVIDIKVDAVMAAAEGMSPAQVGKAVSQMVGGTEAMTMDVDGDEFSVMVEYPEDAYDTLEKIRSATLSTGSGSRAALRDIADIVYKDSPSSIARTDKEYEVTVTAQFAGKVKDARRLSAEIQKETVEPRLANGITVAANSTDESMNEEFASLFQAIFTAVFLLFAVMAAQFESPRFSIMVMTTIPFSLIGAFGLMFLLGVTVSMTSLLGFMMLIGTVVNNGILYIDTVNQMRCTMDLNTALVEAGALRLRPILMTTLTTVISMVPMMLSTDGSASMTSGIAVVNVGGLIAGTVLALLMLPAYYAVVCKKDKKRDTAEILQE